MSKDRFFSLLFFNALVLTQSVCFFMDLKNDYVKIINLITGYLSFLFILFLLTQKMMKDKFLSMTMVLFLLIGFSLSSIWSNESFEFGYKIAITIADASIASIFVLILVFSKKKKKEN
jgi:hypothetical protein